MRASGAAIPRYAVGAVGAALFATAVFYAASYANHSVGPISAVVALAFGSVLVVRTGNPAWQSVVSALRQTYVLLAVVAVGIPPTLFAFSHIDADRYRWVIAQGGVCAHLGSAAILVTAAMISAMLGTGCVGMLLSSRSATRPLWPRAGLLMGVALVASLGLIALRAPETAARVLGCST